ncbi:MAG: hypothetical protein ACI9FR_001554 [Cryomorphaceae bacterium]|jgi:hypothetical protein
MTSATTKEDPELKAWRQKTLKKGVYDLVDLQIFDEGLVEAKPAWVLPHVLLIGHIRNRGSNNSMRWFICGDCETSHAAQEVALTPREAARHFSLLWQAKLGEEVDPNHESLQKLLQQAEALYELTLVDEFWIS